MTATRAAAAIPATRRRPPPAVGRPRAADGTFRPDIEGLRAVAVGTVVLYHAGVPGFGGGYVGVDVFFVISGFLITGLLLRELRRRGTISLPGFYARRALRLLPAATVVTAATVVAAWWWLPPLRLGSILTDALHTAFYGINYRLAAVGTDYLASENAPSPLQHYWSLAVEEQFYLIWPPLLLLVALAARRTRVPLPVAVTAVLAAVAGASLALSVWQTGHSAPWAYFGAHTRAWELAVGGLLAVAAPRLRTLPRPVATALTAAGLAAIGAATALYSTAVPFPGYAALLPVVGAGAIIAGGAGTPSRLLSLPPMRAVGALSYSWYLWHWPFLIIVPHALGTATGPRRNLLIAAAALVAAAVTYRLVENPIRHLPSLRVHAWRGVALGLGATATTAALCLAATAVVPAPTGAGGPVPPTRLADGPSAERELARLLAASARATAVPVNLTPALDEAAQDKPATYAAGCHADFPTTAPSLTCVYGDRSAKTTMVLTGDSHAAHWFPALERIASRRGWRLVSLTKSACSAADVLIWHSTLKRPYRECRAWRHAVWRAVRPLRPAVVVMSSNGSGGRALGVTVDQNEAWADAWVTSAQAFERSGARLVVINDTPWMERDVPECLSEHVDDPARCTPSRRRAILNPGRRTLVAERLSRRGVTVIDPTPWFCADDACPVVAGNVLVYRDSHHMTTPFSRLLAPALERHLPYPPSR